MENILMTVVFFVFYFFFLYVGAKGRIEGKNQITGQSGDYGPLSADEYLSKINGTYKMVAIKQALIGSIIMSGILYLVLYWIN